MELLKEIEKKLSLVFFARAHSHRLFLKDLVYRQLLFNTALKRKQYYQISSNQRKKMMAV